MLESIINSTKKFLVGSALALSLYGCGEEPAVPESSGCTSNEQCRDERVCSQGECVFPEDAVNNGVQEEALIAFGCYDPSTDTGTIRTIHPDGSGEQVIYTTERGIDIIVAGFSWSPNREQIAFSSRKIILLDQNKQDNIEIIPERAGCGGSGWLRDGKHLVVGCGGEDSGAYSLDLETGKLQLILLEEENPTRFYLGQVSDNEFLYVAVARRGGPGGEIYQVDTKNGLEQFITQLPIEYRIGGGDVGFNGKVVFQLTPQNRRGNDQIMELTHQGLELVYEIPNERRIHNVTPSPNQNQFAAASKTSLNIYEKGREPVELITNCPELYSVDW